MEKNTPCFSPHILWIWIIPPMYYDFLGPRGLQGTHMDTLKTKNSKSITFTVRGGFFTFWTILAHSVAGPVNSSQENLKFSKLTGNCSNRYDEKLTVRDIKTDEFLIHRDIKRFEQWPQKRLISCPLSTNLKRMFLTTLLKMFSPALNRSLKRPNLMMPIASWIENQSSEGLEKPLKAVNLESVAPDLQ